MRSMKTGCQQITVYDEEGDDDISHWFYFLSNGKRFYNNNESDSYRTRNINGKRYGFDNRGVMIYQWNLSYDGSATAYQTPANWSYFNNPENGASGDTRGRGLTGVDDNKYIYKAGARIKADSEDRYQVVRVSGENVVNTTDDSVTVTMISASSLRSGDVGGTDVGTAYRNRDNDCLHTSGLIFKAPFPFQRTCTRAPLANVIYPNR